MSSSDAARRRSPEAAVAALAWGKKDSSLTTSTSSTAKPRKLRRIGPGYYEVNVRFVTYLVIRSANGWRWLRGGDASVGGEWRSTMREAAADLHFYLYSI